MSLFCFLSKNIHKLISFHHLLAPEVLVIRVVLLYPTRVHILQVVLQVLEDHAFLAGLVLLLLPSPIFFKITHGPATVEIIRID